MPSRIILVITLSILLLICLFLSAFFSSADMAYGSVNVLRFNTEAEKNTKKAKGILRAKKLTDNYDRSISTIIFSNDLVNACIDSLATLLGINLCYIFVTGESATVQAETWGLIASIIVLVLKITFGEILPKSLSKRSNFKLAVLYSPVIQFLVYLFSPITYPVAKLGDGIAKLLKGNSKDLIIEEDDLHELVDSIEEQGTMDKEKASMLHETIRYATTEAQEIMTPRVNIVALEVNDDITEAVEKGEIFSYSRIPVYEETIDNIIGYVSLRDLISRYILKEDFNLRDILIEPLRFPQSKEINDILRIFKKTKRHFAIIMDEYGGVEGILTMEDILEEIVGEIYDESDEKYKKPIVNADDDFYYLDGDVTLRDFCDLFDFDYDEIDSDYLTIGGFIVELLDDHFAKDGDQVTYKDVLLTVLDVDETGAVSRLSAKRIEEEQKETNLVDTIKSIQERHEKKER